MASLAIAFVYVQSVSTFALHVRASGLSNSVYGMLVSLNGLLIILLELPTTSITQRLRPRPVIACGMLVTGLHAVHLQGEVFHAYCVLYRPAEIARLLGKEHAESR